MGRFCMNFENLQLSHMYRNHAFLYISSLRDACGRDGDARATFSSHHSSKELTNETTNKSIQYQCNACLSCCFYVE